MRNRKDLLELMKAHSVQMKVAEGTRLDDDDDGQWITTANGHRVHLNSEGVPDKGNPHVLAAMNGNGGSGPKKGGSKSALQTYRNHEWGNDPEEDRKVSQEILKSGDQTAIRAKMSDDLDTLYELGKDDPEIASAVIEDYKAAGMYDKLKSEYESTFEEKMPSGKSEPEKKERPESERMRDGAKFAEKTLSKAMSGNVTKDVYGDFGKELKKAEPGTTFVVKTSNSYHDCRMKFSKGSDGKWKQEYFVNGKSTWSSGASDSDIWNSLRDGHVASMI